MQFNLSLEIPVTLPYADENKKCFEAHGAHRSGLYGAASVEFIVAVVLGVAAILTPQSGTGAAQKHRRRASRGPLIRPMSFVYPGAIVDDAKTATSTSPLSPESGEVLGTRTKDRRHLAPREKHGRKTHAQQLLGDEDTVQMWHGTTQSNPALGKARLVNATTNEDRSGMDSKQIVASSPIPSSPRQPTSSTARNAAGRLS